MSEIFYARTKSLDIQEEGAELCILLNEEQARNHGISPMDKVVMLYKGQEIVLDVSLTHKYVAHHEVGIYQDVRKKYKIKSGEKVGIKFTTTSAQALDALKKGLKGGKLTQGEIHAIMQDISSNRFSDTLITYFSALGFFKKAQDEELYRMAKAMAETGEMLHFDGIVADKHCMGGVPGNETTMIMIPLLASLGIKMPKTFSKSITTPAATGECVNVLMDISFSKRQIEGLVKKNNCCLVRGGGLDLAPADEKLIKVAYPLSMQSYSRTVVSIMAKKYAMGINHSLIDIPVGPTAKVPDKKTARWLKKRYEYVGKRLGMKVHVEITDAKEPIGAGVGPVLQVREVLRVLQQHEFRPVDLQNKAVYLASKVIELVGLATGKAAYQMAYQELKSGRAWKMMQKIIKAQGGNPHVHSENMTIGKYKKEVKAEKNGKIRSIDLKMINALTRTLGSPIDEQAGLYLRKKIGDTVKKTDIIYVMYADDEDKIKMALNSLKGKKMYTIN